MISIYTEQTPNPNSLKFVITQMLYSDGSAEFTKELAQKHAPFAAQLFELPFIRLVFISKNFVSITQDGTQEWFEIVPDVKTLIKNYVEEGGIIINDDYLKILEDARQSNVNKAGSIEQQIEEVLDKYIRPAVEMDGGAVYVDSFNEGIVKLMLKGACSGCPSSTITLKSGIEGVLKRFIPEVEEVVQIE